jgi:hypothetical protein
MPTISISRYETDLVSYNLAISDYELEKLKAADKDSQEIIDALFDKQDVTPSRQEPSSSGCWHGFEDDEYQYFEISPF